MSTKGLLLLLGLTAAAVAAAILVGRGRAPAEAGEERLLFPELSERVNDVAEISLAGAEHEATVRHRDDGWGLVEKDFYPVQVEKVKETVLKLADLPIVEAKTSKPENFAALGVQDPDEEGSEAVRVVLRDEAGDELAALVVGQSSYRGGSPSVYVRRAGEDQTWEVEGRLDVDADPLSWIDRQVLQLQNDRVRDAEVRHADGEVLRVEREAEGSRNFLVQDVPPGKKETYPGAGTSVATALSYLRLDDVRPAGEIDFEAEPLATAVFRCYDGLVVSVETARFEDATWARLHARYEEPPAGEEPSAEGAEQDGSAAEGAEAAAPGDEGAEDEPASDQVAEEEDEAADAEAERRDEARQEARKLERNLGPWAFRLPEFKAEALTKRKDALLVDEEPEEPPAPEEGAAAATDEGMAPAAEAPADEAGSDASTSGDEGEDAQAGAAAETAGDERGEEPAPSDEGPAGGETPAGEPEGAGGGARSAG